MASPVAIGANVPLEIRRGDVVHPEAMVEFSDHTGLALAHREIGRGSRPEGLALRPFPADPDDQVVDRSAGPWT
jgi:hypothetical protein